MRARTYIRDHNFIAIAHLISTCNKGKIYYTQSLLIHPSDEKKSESKCKHQYHPSDIFLNRYVKRWLTPYIVVITLFDPIPKKNCADLFQS